MFVWVFHRGLGAPPYRAFFSWHQILYLVLPDDQRPEAGLGARPHTNKLTDSLLIILVVYDALYGMRTVIMDMGLAGEASFLVFTILGVVLSAGLLVLYFTRIIG